MNQIRVQRRLGLVWGIGIACALWLSACATRPTPTSESTPVSATPVGLALQLRTFEALWSTIDEHYLDPDFNGVDWQAVHATYRPQVEAGLSAAAFTELMRAMLADLPDGTATWQTRAERIEQETQDALRYEGIGAFITFRAEPEPRIVLRSVMANSPAEKAGLSAHDSILAIDGTPINAAEGLDAVERIRGPAGSDVTLSIRSPGSSPRDIVVSRAPVTVADELAIGVLGNEDIGYLLFPAATPDTIVQTLIGTLQALNEEGQLSGLVIDLRIASTRGDWPLGEMMALFGRGDLGVAYTRTTTETARVQGQDLFESQSIPLSIIVGPDTQGGPEVFAGAMQGIGRAQIVGMPTPGLVEAVNEYPLPDGSRVFIVTSSYRTPAGRDIGQAGVEPDVVIEIDWDEVTDEVDPVRDAAIEALKPPAPTQGARGGKSNARAFTYID